MRVAKFKVVGLRTTCELDGVMHSEHSDPSQQRKVEHACGRSIFAKVVAFAWCVPRKLQ